MTTGASGQTGLFGSAFDHREGFPAMDSARRELSLPIERAKERCLRLVTDARCGHVVVEILFERVMRRDRMASPALLAKVDPHAATALFVVFNVHRCHCSDASKCVEHRRDHRSVPLTRDGRNIHRVEKLAGLFGGQYRRAADRHDMLRPAHRGRWIHRDDLSRDEPVEEHLQRGEFLFDAWSVDLRPEFLNIGGDEERADVAEADAAFLAPIAEVAHRSAVGFASVSIADRDREEFDQPLGRVFTRITKQFRESVQSGERNLTSRENEGVVSHASEREECV